MIDKTLNPSIKNPAYSTIIKSQKVCLFINQKEILKNLSFDISSEGITFILGPNGAGKTMLLKILAKILPFTSGKLLMDNKNKIGYVSQKTIFLRRSVYQNLLYPLKINNISLQNVNDRIFKLLSISNLERFKEVSARKLSIGQQQLLAVMRALIIKPNILLLDEPCSNLDLNSTNIIEDLLIKASRSGVKIVLVTHDVLQTKRLANDILFVHNGEIIEHEENPNFFSNSRSQMIKNFLNGILLK